MYGIENSGFLSKARLLTSPERWLITLFSQSALISQLCPHCFEKLNYYIFKNTNFSMFFPMYLHVKNCFPKLFWIFHHFTLCPMTFCSTLVFIILFGLTSLPHKMKILSILMKKTLKTRFWTFPTVRYIWWNLNFVSAIFVNDWPHFRKLKLPSLMFFWYVWMWKTGSQHFLYHLWIYR